MANPGFSFEQTIQLPGSVGGHGDWLSYDRATHTVWLAQSPDNNVVVIDTNTNTVKAVIPNIDNANGIAITPQYAFVADPVNNVVDVIDKHSFAVVAKVAATGAGLDGVTYDRATGQVYVASDTNNVLDAINANAPFNQIGSYGLTASPSGPDVPITAKGIVYVPDGTAVDAVDPKTGAVLASPTLVSTGAVKPGVYDPKTDQFFFGTTDKQIEVVSGGHGPGGIGSVTSTIPVAGSTDEAAIDVHSRLAFFGSSAGEVDVVNLDTSKLVAQLPAETGMHTLTVDPQTHELYVYENNRNVVDVWKYNRNGSMARADGPWVHEGSPGHPSFLDHDPGSNHDDGRNLNINALIASLKSEIKEALGSSGSTSSGQNSYQDPSGSQSGWAGFGQWSDHAQTNSVLPVMAHTG